MKPEQIPLHGLYGEAQTDQTAFELHCEAITARSRRHRFEISEHSHQSFLQILMVEAGTGDGLFDGRTERLSPGSLVTMPPLCRHGFRFSPETDGIVVTLDARGSAGRQVLTGTLGAWFDTVRHIRIGDDEDGVHLAQTIRQIAKEFANRQPGRTALLDSLARTALTLAGRIGLAGLGDGRANDDADRRSALLSGLIDRHYREHRPAAFYAEALSLSVTQLNRLVRRMMNASLHDVLSRRLIDQACRDLVFTEMPVREIAHELGYEDSAYFFRVFARETGRTPMEYRREERKKRAF